MSPNEEQNENMRSDDMADLGSDGIRYSIVTVVFEAELLLLSLQARSLARFLDPEMIDQIIVIDNSRDGCLAAPLGSMVERYGALADKVMIVPAAELMPPMPVDGWVSQQVLKLQIARRLSSARYVVLDSKTHLVSRLTRDFLRAEDGRATIHSYSYERHGLLPYLERTFAFLGVPLEPVIADLPTSVPPFTIIRQEAIDLIDHVESASARPFHQTFIDEGLTEFFLYSAWLLKRYGSIERLYRASQPQSPTLWERWTYPDKVRSKLDQAKVSPFFSIHRRSLPKCPKQSLRLIEDFWVDRGLFSRREDARAFIRDFIASYRASFLKERLGRFLRKLRHSTGLARPVRKP